jgi:uncharacterized ParB-like nuclease family protein
MNIRMDENWFLWAFLGCRKMKAESNQNTKKQNHRARKNDHNNNNKSMIMYG